MNPPFGVKGSLANKFINKALTFKPKLLVLIVPKVTKRLVYFILGPKVYDIMRKKLMSTNFYFARLDRKKGGYNLIWEDNEMFSGKVSWKKSYNFGLNMFLVFKKFTRN